jgi:hypothetical protein
MAYYIWKSDSYKWAVCIDPDPEEPKGFIISTDKGLLIACPEGSTLCSRCGLVVLVLWFRGLFPLRRCLQDVRYGFIEAERVKRERSLS